MKEVSIKKVKGGKYRHIFKEEFLEELYKEPALIISDFFPIWIALVKARTNHDLFIYGLDHELMERVEKSASEIVNSFSSSEYKCYTIIKDGLLHKPTYIDNPSKLLELMRMLYKVVLK